MISLPFLQYWSLTTCTFPATRRNAALSGLSHDIHADIGDNQQLQDMHADAEKFDPRTEQVFKVLQVISACAMSFAHGEFCSTDSQSQHRHLLCEVVTFRMGEQWAPCRKCVCTLDVLSSCSLSRLHAAVAALQHQLSSAHGPRRRALALKYLLGRAGFGLLLLGHALRSRQSHDHHPY
jgi:hypothetical protein